MKSAQVRRPNGPEATVQDVIQQGAEPFQPLATRIFFPAVYIRKGIRHR